MTEEQSLFTTRKTAAGNRYEEQPEERKKGLRKLTLKLRLTLLLFVIAIPLTGMVLGILGMIRNYSNSYKNIMANLKTANEYNLKFKEDMEYSMYRVMIGLIDAGQFENGDIIEGMSRYATMVKNPINMINSARFAFDNTIERTPGSDSDIKIRGILSCLDSLENAVSKMIDNSKKPGTYDENFSIWENDIQGLCSMIQDYITQYTYYEILKMEDLQKELEVHTKQIVGGFLAILAGVLTVGFTLSVMITKSVTNPINNLKQTAERLGRGELEARARMCGLEEINVLARTLNRMSDEIAGLMEKTKQEQKSLREAELKLHQEQINPHFLYNTLDSIAWMCEEGRTKDAVEMVNALARLFRISISKGHELIPVEKEVEHAKSYLQIQKFRYKNQFQYSFDVQESCLHYYCNKITLQPIIENAIYHGLNRMIDEGFIEIKIFEDGGDVVFTVEDNGVGMTKEQCESILHKEVKGQTGGIGIKNVNDRVKIYFGEQYGMKIESELDEGTKVSIRMPKLEEDSYEAR